MWFSSRYLFLCQSAGLFEPWSVAPIQASAESICTLSEPFCFALVLPKVSLFLGKGHQDGCICPDVLSWGLLGRQADNTTAWEHPYLLNEGEFMQYWGRMESGLNGSLATASKDHRGKAHLDHGCCQIFSVCHTNETVLLLGGKIPI